MLTAIALTLVAKAAASPATCAEPVETRSISYETRSIEGWTVHIREDLWREQKEATTRALELLQSQLRQIIRVVPGPALARIRTVPLWLTPPIPGVGQTAEYHPDAGWLRANGRDPAMAKGVQFTNIPIFEKENRRMPFFVLHELAHAYHDQILGFDNPEIIQAYRNAIASKSYDAVRRWDGQIVRAYAMTNEKEYFAESAEALFGTNDFFPTNRAELEKHDPAMAKLLERVWNRP
jgi:hypothetical protein